MLIMTVDPNPKFTVTTYGTPLRISSTVDLTCTFRGNEQALATVEARVSPRRRPFVLKDEGSVLVFCVPVLFLYLSVPYILAIACALVRKLRR